MVDGVQKLLIKEWSKWIHCAGGSPARKSKCAYSLRGNRFEEPLLPDKKESVNQLIREAETQCLSFHRRRPFVPMIKALFISSWLPGKFAGGASVDDQ